MSIKAINQMVKLCEKRVKNLRRKGYKQKDFAKALKKELMGRGD